MGLFRNVVKIKIINFFIILKFRLIVLIYSSIKILIILREIIIL